MQIDGHHASTYVAARSAGFSHDEAETIAYAAQYVDDATNGGAIQFKNSEYMYSRIASAHKMIDYNNLLDVENHLAWIPFHFLPGNNGAPMAEEIKCDDISKLICKPDSPIARDMLREAMKDRGSKRALHRLGIAMHVYADTFAHQGFVGALNYANTAENVTSGDISLDNKIKSATKKELKQAVLDNLKAFWQLIAKSFSLMLIERKSPFQFWKDFLRKDPLGHASVDTYPDQPYLVWQYQDWKNATINRNNPEAFMQAINMMSKAMRAWRLGDETMNLEDHDGLDPSDAKVAEELFRELQHPHSEIRHLKWLEAISNGRFSFGKQDLKYIGKGEGSWKESALGTTKAKDNGHEVYPYTPAFINSDWKLFHDSIHAHRSAVVHNILPKYGICAA